MCKTKLILNLHVLVLVCYSGPGPWETCVAQTLGQSVCPRRVLNGPHFLSLLRNGLLRSGGGHPQRHSRVLPNSMGATS